MDKVSYIESLLDRIALQNTKIQHVRQMRHYARKELGRNNMDAECDHIIDGYEEIQAQCAREICKVDNRKTVRSRIACACLGTLSDRNATPAEKQVAAKRFAALNVIPVYFGRFNDRATIFRFLKQAERQYT